MRRRVRSRSLGGARVAILHRLHPTVQALERQLVAIGLVAEQCWPDLPPSAMAADFVFFDADHGHDSQFPWPPGSPPMPMVALIGSEAPGRIEWALNAGADAQLLKPVGDGGVFSALLTARVAFEARRALSDQIAALRQRLEQRQTVVRAVALLMGMGKTEDDAYGQLRAMAMAWRISFEAAAERVVTAQRGGQGAVRATGPGDG